MPANNFLYDTRDLKFILKEWLDSDKLFALPAYADYYSKDDVDSFIEVAYKISRDVIAPGNADSDTIGAQFIDGKVITPDGLKRGYRAVLEAELGPQVANREVEGRLPLTLYSCLLQMLGAANAALGGYFLLTFGATSVIQKYGSEQMKSMFLDKMYSGQWSGTMNLTEPQAGSDLGAVVTKAYPTDTPGLYKLKGSKQFITGGDHDMNENIVHLVLARVEGSKPGTKGLSLFIAPKYRVNEDGSPGKWNDVSTVGIEHKMGQRGSVTCSLAFGENDDCLGYLIGEAPVDGVGQGIAQMFVMMNEERLNTGLYSMACASEAYFNALAYAKERVQGVNSSNPKGGSVRIIEHEDVRRMLMRQKAGTEALRALLVKTYYYMDFVHESEDEAERKYADGMFQVNNPLCKAYASDFGYELITDAIQVYGGNGYIEEYPVSQLARDIKIYSIWEGTNFIQSLDLVGRKFSLEKGEVFKGWLTEIVEFAAQKPGSAELADAYAQLQAGLEAYQSILGLLRGFYATNTRLMPVYSTRILRATACLYCGKLLLEQAEIAAAELAVIGNDHFDSNYYRGKMASARFYTANEMLPTIVSVVKAMEMADTTAIDLPEEAFAQI